MCETDEPQARDPTNEAPNAALQEALGLELPAISRLVPTEKCVGLATLDQGSPACFEAHDFEAPGHMILIAGPAQSLAPKIPVALVGGAGLSRQRPEVRLARHGIRQIRLLFAKLSTEDHSYA